LTGWSLVRIRRKTLNKLAALDSDTLKGSDRCFGADECPAVDISILPEDPLTPPTEDRETKH
jgi:hypothetical protein